MRIMAVLMGALLVSAPALAAKAKHPAARASALALYERGDYAASVAKGMKDGTAESLTIAARAGLADGVLHDQFCQECFKGTEALARRAIALDSKRADAYILLATAIGFESRNVGAVQARVEGYPQKAREAIDSALKLKPADARTLATLGSWNFDIVNFGGKIVGEFIYDASADAGKTYFIRAMKADPGNKLIPYEFALCLAAYDFDTNKDQIQMLLAVAASAKPGNTYERAIHDRAVALGTLFLKGNKDVFLAKAKRYQGYS